MFAEVAAPVSLDGEVLIPTGSRLVGAVSDLQAGRVEITFATLVTPGGIERSLDGVVAMQGTQSGLAAEVSDPLSPKGFDTFLTNTLTAAGQQLTQPLSSYTYGGAAGSYGALNNAPIEQRLLGSVLQGIGSTVQQSGRYQKSETRRQPIQFKVPPTDFVIRLTKGMDF